MKLTLFISFRKGYFLQFNTFWFCFVLNFIIGVQLQLEDDSEHYLCFFVLFFHTSQMYM